MYYEEETFNGVLHWRDTPGGSWKAKTTEQLTSMLAALTVPNKSPMRQWLESRDFSIIHNTQTRTVLINAINNKHLELTADLSSAATDKVLPMDWTTRQANNGVWYVHDEQGRTICHDKDEQGAINSAVE